MVGQAAALGGILALVAGGVGWAAGGPAAGRSAAAFGALAALLHTVAAAMAQRSLAAGDYRGLLARWGAGTVLRMGGVAMIAVAAVRAPNRWPPVPGALGYLMVLLTLLFLEIRRFR